MAEDSIGQVASLTMHLGLALHRYGTPTHALEDMLSQVARHYGVPSHVLATPTYMTAAFGSGSAQRVYLTRAAPGDIDLEKLSLLESLTGEILAGERQPPDALARIDAIVAAPQRYPPWVTVLAYLLASGAVACLFAGGWREAAAAAIIGGMTGALALLAERISTLGRLFEMSAACLGGLLAPALLCCFGPFSAATATLAGLIVLLPGLSLTTAMTELATGHLLAGTARLTGAGVTFMKLGFGTALGTRLGAPLLALASSAAPTPPAMSMAHLALPLAALALSLVLRAEPRALGWIVLNSYLGLWGTRLGGWLLGPGLGACVAAFAVTLGSNLYARGLKRSATVVQVPGVLLLVPGSIGYRSVDALLRRDVLDGMTAAFHMVLTAMALVAGILLANLLFPGRKERPPKTVRVPPTGPA